MALKLRISEDQTPQPIVLDAEFQIIMYVNIICQFFAIKSIG